jgi:ABC-type cobalamin/Fe3+-siderophores transport system ATPase subunit
VVSALRIDSLVVGRRGFRVGPFDIEIPPRTLGALVGPNGCGQTTLLRTIAGLLPPLAGFVELPDTGMPALLPAPGSIKAASSAEHLVALGRAARAMVAGADRGGSRNGARGARGTRHRQLAERAFDRLSSGQQQLVLLARLLVQDAAVCLLDEPTALLDPTRPSRARWRRRCDV